MHIYTNNTATGYYPVGFAAVVYASSRNAAANKLNRKLKEMGLPGDATSENMIQFSELTQPGVRILVDGNY